MSNRLKVMKLIGEKDHLRQFLNDPINWVVFINRYDMSKEELRHWRNHFGLEHTFDDEFGA